VDTVAGERAEASLTAFIGKRDEQRRAEEGERPAEELWAASERIYAAKRWRQRAWDWVRFYQEQAVRAERNGAEVAAANRRKAEALISELENETKGEAA
jgi:hypothetical protein